MTGYFEYQQWRFKHFIGKYITLSKGKKKTRKRIKDVLDENPADKSVGIWFGSLTVELHDGKVVDLVTNGSVVDTDNPKKKTWQTKML